MRWLDSGYRRWWWRNHSRAIGRGALAALGLAVVAMGGFVAADALEAAPSATTFTTQRLVTVVRKVDGRTETQVLTQTVKGEVTTEPATTRYVTVTRDGRTVRVAVRVPGKTITKTSIVHDPGETVTNTRTNTRTETEHSTETQTVDHPPTTVTHTETQTADPGRVTVTETQVRTDTQTVPGPTTTVTDTRTVTDTATVTETVTQPPPGP